VPYLVMIVSHFRDYRAGHAMCANC
jgi:hypothetical protein